MRDARLAQQLEPRAQVAAALVYVDSGRPVLDDLKADDVAKEGPPVVVLTGVPPTRKVFATGGRLPAVVAVAAIRHGRHGKAFDRRPWAGSVADVRSSGRTGPQRPALSAVCADASRRRAEGRFAGG